MHCCDLDTCCLVILYSTSAVDLLSSCCALHILPVPQLHGEEQQQHAVVDCGVAVVMCDTRASVCSACCAIACSFGRGRDL